MATQREVNPLTTIELPYDDNPLEHAYKRFGITVIAGAFLLALLYGGFVAEPGQRIAALVAAFLAAAAPFTVGGLLGFLFGIPRTLQDSGGQTAADNPEVGKLGAPAATGTARQLPHRAYQDNTNLEQISDWLTKIIVGIGLTQLTQLPAMVESTGAYIAGAISSRAPAVVGSLILIVFSISGFVIAYLVTKADLARELDLRRLRDRSGR